MIVSDDIKVHPYTQGQIQVLWSLKLIQFLEPFLRERIKNYECKIRYESEYLLTAFKGPVHVRGPLASR